MPWLFSQPELEFTGRIDYVQEGLRRIERGVDFEYPGPRSPRKHLLMDYPLGFIICQVRLANAYDPISRYPCFALLWDRVSCLKNEASAGRD